jgi:hypothetical protein
MADFSIFVSLYLHEKWSYLETDFSFKILSMSSSEYVHNITNR